MTPSKSIADSMDKPITSSSQAAAASSLAESKREEKIKEGELLSSIVTMEFAEKPPQTFSPIAQQE